MAEETTSLRVSRSNFDQHDGSHLNESESPCYRGSWLHWSLSFVCSILMLANVVLTGSHVIYTLQKTRRYKVISIDNHHNSHSTALDRVSRLSKSELAPNPTELDIQSTEIDTHKCDLTKPEEIRSVFETYGKGGIWGVVHIAVSAFRFFSEIPDKPASPGIQSRRRVNRNSLDLLHKQCIRHGLPPTNHVRLRLYPNCILILRHRLRYTTYYSHPRDDQASSR